MTALVNRHTSAPVCFVAGLSLVIRAFEDVYGNLEGRRLEALARLFAQNVRIYVYPMTIMDLDEWLKSVCFTGWEWTETNVLDLVEGHGPATFFLCVGCLQCRR